MSILDSAPYAGEPRTNKRVRKPITDLITLSPGVTLLSSVDKKDQEDIGST
jgi:hypothetical protein